jgi:alpha-glucosidase (family GH31 glycosyl hydrolase)
MAGIPFVGYPVCGYNKVDQDLYLRWYQLAIYLPEMHLHHDGTSNKEPTEKVFQQAIEQRYRIARFLYTKVYEAEIWGGAIWEPLAFVFPKDQSTYKENVIENTFMIGRTLYITPKIVNDKSNIKVYLLIGIDTVFIIIIWLMSLLTMRKARRLKLLLQTSTQMSSLKEERSCHFKTNT